MAGVRSLTKRGNVRRFLLTKEGQKSSDREAGVIVGVSKTLIATVRRELIAAGLHPNRREQGIPHTGDRPIYQPGSAARGGYVYDERGQVIREAVWQARQRKKSKRADA